MAHGKGNEGRDEARAEALVAGGWELPISCLRQAERLIQELMSEPYPEAVGSLSLVLSFFGGHNGCDEEGCPLVTERMATAGDAVLSIINEMELTDDELLLLLSGITAGLAYRLGAGRA